MNEIFLLDNQFSKSSNTVDLSFRKNMEFVEPETVRGLEKAKLLDYLKILNFYKEHNDVKYYIDAEEELRVCIPLPYSIILKDYDNTGSEIRAVFNDCIKSNEELLRNELNVLEHIYDLVKDVSFDDTNYSMQFQGMSSGEYSKLTLLSRVHWESVKNKENNLNCWWNDKNELMSNLFLFIDEGETHFHPEWQRSFVYELINFVNKWFLSVSRVKNIHILITTNSPFIMADLPNNNNKALVKGQSVHVSSNKNVNTFAQNIHEILSTSFFLDSFLGQYADFIISKMIDQLNTNNEGNIDFDEIESVFEEIGEPILKTRLFDVYEKKKRDYSVNNRKEHLIELYESKLKELEKLNDEIKKL